MKKELGKLFYKYIPNALLAIKDLTFTKKVHSRGITFTLVSDNWITKYRARSFNDKEPEMLDWLDINLQKGDTFFDVGANVGIYSVYAALRNPGAMIYSFEPEYSNLHLLKKNIINNNLLENIVPFSIAISDQVGLSYLHIQDFTPGAALSTESTQNITKTSNKKPIWKEGIGTSTLDQISDSFGLQPNLIKIDVDGNEMKILNGGKNTLSNPNMRSIIIEMIEGSPNNVAISNCLKSYGFKLEGKFIENQIWSKK